MKLARSRTVQNGLSARHDQKQASDTPKSAGPGRLLRFPAVFDRTGLSRSTIRRLERCGRFPRHFQISAGAVAWREDHIAEWLENATGGQQ
jgi:prophage regulatory protein